MDNVTLAEVKTQADLLSPEDRRRLIEELGRDLQAQQAPRRSIMEFAGAIPWDGQDVDERVRRLREEWNDR